MVFLFTFGDTLRETDYPEAEKRPDYLDLLEDHAKSLTKSLRRCCGKEIPEIKLVLDVDVNELKLDCIMAVPVGRSLVKGVAMSESEIFRKSHPLDRIKLEKIGHRVRLGAGVVVGVCMGNALGVMAGAVIGAAIGGVGAFPGAAAGAIAGGVQQWKHGADHPLSSSEDNNNAQESREAVVCSSLLAASAL